MHRPYICALRLKMKLLTHGLSPPQPAMTAPQPPVHLPRILNTCRGSRSLAESWGTGAGHTDPTGALLAVPQACELIPKRAAGNCKSSVNLLPGTLQEHQACNGELPTQPILPLGTHRLHPFQTSPLDFILIKAQAHPGSCKERTQ